MSPKAESGSGPVDGEEVHIDIEPHHSKTPAKKRGKLVKIAVAGGAAIVGVVILYFLYKKFWGKKKDAGKDGKGKLKKRGMNFDNVENEMRIVYEDALGDDGFLEFLDEMKEAGIFDENGFDEL